MIGVDDNTRHDAANVNCSLPDVVVLSEYVPSELAVHVPDTWSDPVTGSDAQLVFSNDRSSTPDTWRQEDIAVQVPTTSPPQAATFEEQDDPPELALPPEVPAAPPLDPVVATDPIVVPEAPDEDCEAAPPSDPPPLDRDEHATIRLARTRRQYTRNLAFIATPE